MKIIKNINEVSVEDVYKLYDEAFNDEIEYRESLFSSYLKYSKFFGVVEKETNKLIMITFFNPKRVWYKNKKMNGFLIFAVAVKKEYQNKGYMKKFLNEFVKEMDVFDQLIFIQAYNWDVYKSFNFITCTEKSRWILRKDQFLKPTKWLEKINYDLINDINIKFIKENCINDFTYKTEKENKRYLKLYEKCSNKILMTNKSYLIYNEVENIIHEYGYVDLKDFIRLLSNLPINCKIESIINLDKRFFTMIEDKKPFTKLLNNKNEMVNDIYFFDNW